MVSQEVLCMVPASHKDEGGEEVHQEEQQEVQKGLHRVGQID